MQTKNRTRYRHPRPERHPRPSVPLRMSLVKLALLGLPVGAGAQQAATPTALPDVEVVAPTPLPGINVPRDQVPSNVQAFSGADMKRQQSNTLADHLNANVGSVFVNEAQNNPYQPDITFRGFTASPLLGNPIGISVFVDGVRVNESFGDTVFWDLIPDAAVRTVNLIPGANPVFGLNTLGGALAVRTKSGRTDPGIEAEIGAGSFGAKAVQVSAGGASGAFDGFLSAAYRDEDGWRDHSPSRVQQFFGKAGWHEGATGVDLSYTFADNKLIGNGMAPESMLKQRREAVYTWPDETKPRLSFLNLSASHVFGDGLTLSGNAYHRDLKVRTFNGDAEYDDGGTPGDISDDEYEASNRRSATEQTTYGVGVQLALHANLGALEHRFAAGLGYDHGQADFAQYEQAALFTPDRGTVADGDYALNTAVQGENTYAGVYLTDTIALAERAHLTVSGRYDKAKVEIHDKSGAQTELNGDHSFNRFNPAIGLTWAATPAATFYGSYNEGFRVPTAVELTCADPDAPCALPVSFVADPPLKPVVSKSFEAGVRGRLAGGLNWNASFYRADLADDILFTAIGAGRGFFANVPRTRRQGIELGLGARANGLNWNASYALVDASFRSATALFNPVANEEDPSQPETIAVDAGNKLPGTPRHRLKLAADYRFNDAVTVGASASYASSQFLRGDEGNQHAQLPGYTIVNLRFGWQLNNAWSLVAKVNNVFDKDYSSVGAFNRNGFGADGQALEGVGPGPVERFLSPGAPRSFWVGLQYRLGD